eukprot:TRINITY_DN1215_c0_g1_i13.p1 TRINITY_DN1215_c0_g1~~TRINITY_DN1215_c0_g1_i13.p1  ORF type:complete len:171 (+),score=16.10 TRINITY_DN1215_c0_g1_i13:814-1326(+)
MSMPPCIRSSTTAAQLCHSWRVVLCCLPPHRAAAVWVHPRLASLYREAAARGSPSSRKQTNDLLQQRTKWDVVIVVLLSQTGRLKGGTAFPPRSEHEDGRPVALETTVFSTDDDDDPLRPPLQKVVVCCLATTGRPSCWRGGGEPTLRRRDGVEGSRGRHASCGRAAQLW